MFEGTKLNRRHKAALFLTLLAAGISLTIGAGPQTTTGIVLLGLAFAWIFGSDSRLVHSLFVLAGLLLTAGPLLVNWNENRQQSRLYKDRVADFEHKIPQLANNYPLPKVQEVLNDPKFHALSPKGQKIVLQTMQNGLMTRLEFAQRLKQQDPDLASYTDDSLVEGVLSRRPELRAYIQESLVQWYADAIRAGVDVPAIPDTDKPGNPPRPFSFERELSEHWLSTCTGLSLLVIGLGLLLARRTKALITRDS